MPSVVVFFCFQKSSLGFEPSPLICHVTPEDIYDLITLACIDHAKDTKDPRWTSGEPDSPCIQHEVTSRLETFSNLLKQNTIEPEKTAQNYIHGTYQTTSNLLYDRYLILRRTPENLRLKIGATISSLPMGAQNSFAIIEGLSKLFGEAYQIQMVFESAVSIATECDTRKRQTDTYGLVSFVAKNACNLSNKISYEASARLIGMKPEKILMVLQRPLTCAFYSQLILKEKSFDPTKQPPESIQFNCPRPLSDPPRILANKLTVKKNRPNSYFISKELDTPKFYSNYEAPNTDTKISLNYSTDPTTKLGPLSLQDMNEAKKYYHLTDYFFSNLDYLFQLQNDFCQMIELSSHGVTNRGGDDTFLSPSDSIPSGTTPVH